MSQILSHDWSITIGGSIPQSFFVNTTKVIHKKGIYLVIDFQNNQQHVHVTQHMVRILYWWSYQHCKQSL